MSEHTSELAESIETAFPFVEMPPFQQLIDPAYVEFEYLRKGLEVYRTSPMDGAGIRLVHQELSRLTAIGWRWILPHHLRFCLTSEAENNRMETEFLIYNLGPDLKFQTDTSQRLSLLTHRQVQCLIKFLVWCEEQEYWRDYCPDQLSRAIGFLRTMLMAHQSE